MANSQPDRTTREELEDAKLQRYRAKTQGLTDDNEGRKKYAHCTFRLICWWVFMLFFMLFLSGIFSGEGLEYKLGAGDVLKIRFALSDTVLVTLLGASTATVIGLFAAVLFYLFPKGRQVVDAPDAFEDETASSEKSPENG